ncbi:hypothetical protein FB567DRAFT_612372 [Paraphoma chrysanthemicola]|uniref:Uncharacterized protein n=1 Tax=Paraphoma chrysanthemicola TaxID=798071 RepID=A0A8K0QUD2_9PLEO|nr:hypothetical protein FB567DRAFT_612372 [Paraphoma chrysanthemicola]
MCSISQWQLLALLCTLRCTLSNITFTFTFTVHQINHAHLNSYPSYRKTQSLPTSSSTPYNCHKHQGFAIPPPTIMSFQDSYIPFPRPHAHIQNEPPTPPPRYSGYRDPSTPHGLGSTRRPGTGPLPLLPVQTVQSSPSEKTLPCPPAAPVTASPLPQPAPHLPSVPPHPDPEIFPADLPPRPAPVQSRLARLPVRFYISPRPRLNQYEQDVELGTLPSRREEVRRREELVSPELPRGNGRQRSGWSVRWSQSWWRVMCSVKAIVGLAIVVAFWVFIILGAAGKVVTVA